MHYLTVSFTHKNSTLEIRERLAYSDDDSKARCLEKLCAHPCINEAILISTCNRLEVFSSCSSVIDASEHIFTMLSERSKIALEELEGRADVFDDQGAIHHLFSVASSLDSMVVGETQIAGQLKDAYRFSLEKGFCAQKITRAMQFAFRCAAEVRNVTDISSKPVSVASVSVAKAKQIQGELSDKRALIIGAGEMSMIVGKHLASAGAKVTLMNRTRERAETLARECGGSVLGFEELPGAVNMFDMIFTATASETPVIRREMVREVPFERYWFDLAVPRDIEEMRVDGLEVFQVDDLKSIVEDNISLREEEAKASYIIVGRYTMEFFDWLKALSVEPLIKAMYERAFEAVDTELARALDKGFLPEAYEAQSRKMAQQSMKRFLHEITARLRNVSEQSRADDLIESCKFLLNEEEIDPDTNSHPKEHNAF